MPANINSMMYVGAIPWHGLGKRLEAEATAAEAIVAAGLDWTVEQTPLLAKGIGPVETHQAIVREDTKAILGIVGSGYRPHQRS